MEFITKHWLGLEPTLTAKARLPMPEAYFDQTKKPSPLNKNLYEAINYLRVSPHLHLANIGITGLEGILFMTTEFNVYTAIGQGVLFGLQVGNVLTSYINLNSYNWLYAHLKEFGWNNWGMETRIYSICSRNILRVAAADAGFEKEATELFIKKGTNGLSPLVGEDFCTDYIFNKRK